MKIFCCRGKGKKRWRKRRREKGEEKTFGEEKYILLRRNRKTKKENIWSTEEEKNRDRKGGKLIGEGKCHNM